MCATPSYLASHGRPKKPADLAEHECIRRLGSVPETSWTLVNRKGTRVRAKVGGRLECSDAWFQTEVLYGGFGIGLRPAAEVRRAVDAGTLEQVLPSYFLDRIPVWPVSPKGRQRIPRVMKVAEVLSKVVATLSE